MILYHGSTVLVDKPELGRNNSYLDFGNGFYTTTSYEQAKRWAQIKMRRNNAALGYVSIYELDFEKVKTILNITQFHTADKNWLEFVVNNRKGILSDIQSDIIIGPVADDNVYQSIRLFETGAYDAEYTIKKLKTEILHDQWTLQSHAALSHLIFIKAEEIN